MTRTYAAKRLLEHGPLTHAEFLAITGWPVRAAELGLPAYDGLEQFPDYKRRVMAAHQQGAH